MGDDIKKHQRVIAGMKTANTKCVKEDFNIVIKSSSVPEGTLETI